MLDQGCAEFGSRLWSSRAVRALCHHGCDLSGPVGRGTRTALVCAEDSAHSVGRASLVPRTPQRPSAPKRSCLCPLFSSPSSTYQDSSLYLTLFSPSPFSAEQRPTTCKCWRGSRLLAGLRPGTPFPSGGVREGQAQEHKQTRNEKVLVVFGTIFL